MFVTTYERHEWDSVAKEYVVKERRGYEYNGPIVLMKKKGGIFRKILGAVAAIAVTAFAPQLGLSAWQAGALGGALGGGISGGWKGALTGGILGAAGGYAFGSEANGGLGWGDKISNAWSGGTESPINGLESNVASGGQSVAGSSGSTAPIEGSSATLSGTGDAINPSGVTYDIGGQSVPGSALNGQNPLLARAGLDASGPMSFSPEVATNLSSYGTSFAPLPATSPSSLEASGSESEGAPKAGLNPQGYTNEISNNALPGESGYGWKYYDNGTAISPNGQYFHEGNAITGAGGSGTPGNDWFGDFNWKNAAGRAGMQLLGAGLSKATEPSYMKDYADKMGDVSDFNMAMANKKAAIGDTLAGNAAGMNPDYYAEQQRRARQNFDNAAWLDSASRMRAMGKDENYINNEQRRFQLGTSQNQGTAYDSGYTSGVQNQNATYTAAGGMYGQVSDPTAGMYSAYAQQNQNRAANIGRGLDDIYGAGTGSNKTGTATTRNKEYDMYGNVIG